MKSQNSQICFPDITPFLCGPQAVSLKTVIEEYSKVLLDTQNPYLVGYANLLLAYMMVSIPSNLSPFVKHIKKWMKKKGYEFNIQFSFRKKSFFKYNQKIRLYILKALASDSIEERNRYSLDRISDILGIRLILDLGKEDNEYTTQICYELMNEVLTYFTSKEGYSLRIIKPLQDLGLSTENHPDVFIPSKSGIDPAFANNVKDYYRFPKGNLYQSIHASLKPLANKSSLPLEIQIRSLTTHLRVEYCEGVTHFAHDSIKYHYPECKLDIDLSKINIKGFRYLDYDKIYDSVGLTQASILTTISIN